jgi:hypothetical protein
MQVMISVSKMCGLWVRDIPMVWLCVFMLLSLVSYVAGLSIWSVYGFESDLMFSQSVCGSVSFGVLSVVSDFVLCTQCNIRTQFVYQCV